MKRDITIDEKILSIYPEIRLGVLHLLAKISKPRQDFWEYMEDDFLPKIREEIKNKEWNEIPGIKCSRAVYKAFGRDPGRYRVSSEALIRRVRRGDELYHINSVVDVNNLISVKSGLSVGSYDLDKVQGEIVLRKAEAGEGYTGIGKDFLNMENMLVLTDDLGLFGSSMSDSTRTMVTEETKDVLVVIYCFDQKIELKKIIKEAEDAFRRFAEVSDIESWEVK